LAVGEDLPTYEAAIRLNPKLLEIAPYSPEFPSTSYGPRPRLSILNEESVNAYTTLSPNINVPDTPEPVFAVSPPPYTETQTPISRDIPSPSGRSTATPISPTPGSLTATDGGTTSPVGMDRPSSSGIRSVTPVIGVKTPPLQGGSENITPPVSSEVVRPSYERRGSMVGRMTPTNNRPAPIFDRQTSGYGRVSPCPALVERARSVTARDRTFPRKNSSRQMENSVYVIPDQKYLD